MLPKPYTVPTNGPVGRYLEAVGQHPWRPAHIHFKVTAPGHRTARHAGLLPGRSLPGERHHRRGQAGARAAGRAGERPPHVQVRHRAGPTVSLTFDNLGEVADLERGQWPADAPLGRHASVTRTLPRVLELLDVGGCAGDVLRRGAERRAVSGRAARDRRRAGTRSRSTAGSTSAGPNSRPGGRARVVRARRDALWTRLGLRPVGFRPPGGELTPATLGLLREFGFEYCSPRGRRRSRRATGSCCCRSAGS